MDGMTSTEFQRRYRAEFGIECRRAPARRPDCFIDGKGYYRAESGQYWSPADGNGKLIPIQGRARR